ncbi:PfkB family carbohydrate kinase [Aureimonas leprariae]|uniref:Carbohydrate kinase n=1 Tax=Plantimonas leprariae TaxID=2615207 RepID=A0A7V7PQY4_9HYPH|nr:PfkB family carbohydrate kinase [Aureimonas leprariae]KAB0680856.1 carbohydrate kinase [Aureimonas leprariae]
MSDPASYRDAAFFVAGGAHIDRRGRCRDAFEPGASNPGTMTELVGGAALNAARVLRGFGSPVRLVSARGGDGSGEVVARALAALDIDDMSMTWLDRRTPTYTAILDVTGDLVGGLADMALYDLMRPRVFTRRHIREALAAADALLLDANLPAETIEHLANEAGKRPIFAIGVSPAKAVRLAPALPKLAALFVSRAEAAAITGASPDGSAGALAERLAEAGCRRAVVTDGPRPATIVFDGEMRRQMPPEVRSLHDVTGAGDTLAGAASFAFAAGEPFLEAVRFGMVAASLHVSAERRSGDFTVDAIREAARKLPPPTENDHEFEDAK